MLPYNVYTLTAVKYSGFYWLLEVEIEQAIMVSICYTGLQYGQFIIPGDFNDRPPSGQIRTALNAA